MTQPHPARTLRPPMPSVVLLDPETDEEVSTRLRARMGNVALIEERYGSLAVFQEALEALTVATDDDADPMAAYRIPLFTPIIAALACLMPDGPLQSPHELGRWLDSGRAGEYGQAIGEVLSVAFSGLAAGAVDGQGNDPSPTPTATTGTVVSTGVPSTTPPPSSSDGPTPSSGT